MSLQRGQYGAVVQDVGFTGHGLTGTELPATLCHGVRGFIWRSDCLICFRALTVMTTESSATPDQEEEIPSIDGGLDLLEEGWKGMRYVCCCVFFGWLFFDPLPYPFLRVRSGGHCAPAFSRFLRVV